MALFSTRGEIRLCYQGTLTPSTNAHSIQKYIKALYIIKKLDYFDSLQKLEQNKAPQ
jgi:hypothetical protein